MINEPQRLQYLEAMGLTAWTARYRLPGAAETPVCDWPEVAPAPAQAPQARLQALLQEPAAPPRRESPEATPKASPETAAGPGRAKALLGEAPQAPAAKSPEAKSPEAQPQTRSAEPAPSTEPPQALRFSVQLMALEGRWLVLLPEAPSAMEQRLLNNLGRAAGLPLAAPAFQRFDWPMMEGLPVEAPLEEAREGLKAFIAGRGWHPERLLALGMSPDLARVLAIDAEHSQGLALPAWQGPSLAELARDAEAKRALWPRLRAWGQAWSAGEAGGDA